MYLASLEHTLRRHPEWREPLGKLLSAIDRFPAGRSIDPEQLAQMASLGEREVVAFLKILSEQHLGDLMVRVVDARGLEVSRFPNLREVPAVVEDEFGDTIEVTPENVEIVFVASYQS